MASSKRSMGSTESSEDIDLTGGKAILDTVNTINRIIDRRFHFNKLPTQDENERESSPNENEAEEEKANTEDDETVLTGAAITPGGDEIAPENETANVYQTPDVSRVNNINNNDNAGSAINSLTTTEPITSGRNTLSSSSFTPTALGASPATTTATADPRPIATGTIAGINVPTTQKPDLTRSNKADPYGILDDLHPKARAAILAADEVIQNANSQNQNQNQENEEPGTPTDEETDDDDAYAAAEEQSNSPAAGFTSTPNYRTQQRKLRRLRTRIKQRMQYQNQNFQENSNNQRANTRVRLNTFIKNDQNKNTGTVNYATSAGSNHTPTASKRVSPQNLVTKKHQSMLTPDKYGPLQLPGLNDQMNNNNNDNSTDNAAVAAFLVTPNSAMSTSHNASQMSIGSGTGMNTHNTQRMSMSSDNASPRKSPLKTQTRPQANNNAVSTGNNTGNLTIANVNAHAAGAQGDSRACSPATNALIQAILPAGVNMSVPNMLLTGNAGGTGTIIDPSTGLMKQLPPDKILEYNQKVAALAVSLGARSLPSMPNSLASGSNSPADKSQYFPITAFAGNNTSNTGNTNLVNASINNNNNNFNNNNNLNTNFNNPAYNALYANVNNNNNASSVSNINNNNLNSNVSGMTRVSMNADTMLNMNNTGNNFSGQTFIAGSQHLPPTPATYYSFVTPVQARNNNPINNNNTHINNDGNGNNNDQMSSQVPDIPIWSRYYHQNNTSNTGSQSVSNQATGNAETKLLTSQSVPNPSSDPKKQPRPKLDFFKAQNRFRGNRPNPHPLISDNIPGSGKSSMYPDVITQLPISAYPFCVKLNTVPTARHGISDRMDYVMKYNYFLLYVKKAADRPGYSLRYLSRMPTQLWVVVKWKFIGCRQFSDVEFLRRLSNILPAANVLRQTFFCTYGSNSNEEVIWYKYDRHLQFSSLRTICFCPLKFYEALVQSGRDKTRMHWYSEKLNQICDITNWSLVDVAVMKILEIIDLICEHPTAKEFITEYTGAVSTETSDMRRRYKRCYACYLRYIHATGIKRKDGGTTDIAIEHFVQFLTEKVGLSTDFFDIVRWKIKDTSTQQVQWQKSDTCKLYICDYAFFDSPALIQYYDATKDEYQMFIPALGYTVHINQWRINEKSYANIVGRKPFSLSLDTIQEKTDQLPLPENPVKWAELAINDDIEFIPYYVDVNAVLSCLYGEKKPEPQHSMDQMNDGGWQWLDYAFNEDPALLSGKGQAADKQKLASVLQEPVEEEEKKEDFAKVAPSTPNIIRNASEQRKKRYYEKKETFGYITDVGKSFSHYPSTPARMGYNIQRIPSVKNYMDPKKPVHRRPPLKQQQGYITDQNSSTDVYAIYANVEYSDESDETGYVGSQYKPDKQALLQNLRHHQRGKANLTDGDIDKPIFNPFSKTSEMNISGNDGNNVNNNQRQMSSAAMKAIQTIMPTYSDQAYREALDLARLYVVDEERMEKYIQKTICPARYFVNPLLIWIEFPVKILRDNRAILPAGKQGRTRLEARINDRKYRRRAKGKTYYNTTLPAGWTLKITGPIKDISKWDLLYAQMVDRQEQRLSKLRVKEKRDYWDKDKLISKGNKTGMGSNQIEKQNQPDNTINSQSILNDDQETGDMVNID